MEYFNIGNSEIPTYGEVGADNTITPFIVSMTLIGIVFAIVIPTLYSKKIKK
jgi:hypothetical protein